MPTHIFTSSSNLLPTITFLLLSNFSTFISSQTDSASYNQCSPYKCGNITFTFPFSSSDTFGSGPQDCGLPRFQIACDSSSVPGLQLSGRLYQVKSLFSSERLITLIDTQLITDLKMGTCDSLRNLSVSNNYIYPLRLPAWNINLTFFDCSQSRGANISADFPGKVVHNYTCNEEGRELFLFDEVYSDEIQLDPLRSGAVGTPSGCQLVTVPVSQASLSTYGLLKSGEAGHVIQYLNTSGVGVGVGSGGVEKVVFDVLGDGFPLEWPAIIECESCERTRGRCGYDGNSGQIVCFCNGGCGPVKNKKSNRKKIITGVATGTCSVVVIVLLLLIIFKKKTSLIFIISHHFAKNQRTDQEDGMNAKQFIKDYKSTILTNYSYSDIKKMTNGFKEKLGSGGSGNVYKGTFSDGRLVAVKLLEKCNKDGHNFINEVATIGQIHHVNVIRLLGFCWDGSKQALIYEYMPNGSLGDLLSKEEVKLSLGLPKLLEIAVGIGRGIEYLHNGCESRILHLDIKPQNVLLDQNFVPKISDFGLAKVHSRNRSVVTMTGAGGTIGYIAPEIFMRNLGNPSHKSDVYSYGMLLLAMDSGGKRDEPNTTSSEEYFPGWIYDKLVEEKDVEHIDHVEDAYVYIEKKMKMVGLWCIQINPGRRPSMTRVVEMLCGNVEAIEMPPKPFFSLPRVQFERVVASFESDSNEGSDLPLTSDSHETQN